MLPSSAPLETSRTPKVLQLAPKDTADDLDVKPRAIFRTESRRFLQPSLAMRLALTRKIRITRGIRGFRPEAERTVSANSPYLANLMWQGQLARRPVFPPSELLTESFPKGSKGLTPVATPTPGKDTHASL
jgi:hypothetical protein